MKVDQDAQQESLVELISFSPEGFNEYRNEPIADLLGRFQSGWVNWINLDGDQEPEVYQALGERFRLHHIALETLTSGTQPKAEEFDGYIFFSLKMLHHITQNKIEYEQISFVLGKDFLISTQEKAGDFFEHLRQRLRENTAGARRINADQLLHKLLEVIIDRYYDVLDDIGNQIEDIEEDILHNPSNKEFQKIQRTKKELIFLRKALYPLRDALSKLTKSDSELVSRESSRYFNDLYYDAVQMIGSLDTYRDLVTSLMDIHINTVNTRMNEVMKVLAVISTIFMPLTFIVGIYGMNFDHMPELRWPFGYLYVVILMVSVVLAMLLFFRHKKWF